MMKWLWEIDQVATSDNWMFIKYLLSGSLNFDIEGCVEEGKGFTLRFWGLYCEHIFEFVLLRFFP